MVETGDGVGAVGVGVVGDPRRAVWMMGWMGVETCLDVPGDGVVSAGGEGDDVLVCGSSVRGGECPDA